MASIPWPPPRPPLLSLALEEVLARRCPAQQALAWTSWPAVIAGRTSNPPDYDCREARRLSIPVYRRRSGGGSVVLGPGVLSIALLLPGWPRHRPATRYGARIIAESLEALGLEAGIANEGDIVVWKDQSYKVGGSASYTIGSTVVYHATLIVDEPTDTMYTLTPPRRDRVQRGEVDPVKYRPKSLWQLAHVSRRSLLEALTTTLAGKGFEVAWIYTKAADCPESLGRAEQIAVERLRDPYWRPCLAAENLAGSAR